MIKVKKRACAKSEEQCQICDTWRKGHVNSRGCGEHQGKVRLVMDKARKVCKLKQNCGL